MATTTTDFRAPSMAGFAGKWHHWTYNRKGRLSLHKGGVDSKCNRVHYNQKGEKE